MTLSDFKKDVDGFGDGAILCKSQYMSVHIVLCCDIAHSRRASCGCPTPGLQLFKDCFAQRQVIVRGPFWWPQKNFPSCPQVIVGYFRNTTTGPRKVLKYTPCTKGLCRVGRPLPSILGIEEDIETFNQLGSWWRPLILNLSTPELQQRLKASIDIQIFDFSRWSPEDAEKRPSLDVLQGRWKSL